MVVGAAMVPAAPSSKVATVEVRMLRIDTRELGQGQHKTFSRGGNHGLPSYTYSPLPGGERDNAVSPRVQPASMQISHIGRVICSPVSVMIA